MPQVKLSSGGTIQVPLLASMSLATDNTAIIGVSTANGVGTISAKSVGTTWVSLLLGTDLIVKLEVQVVTP